MVRPTSSFRAQRPPSSARRHPAAPPLLRLILPLLVALVAACGGGAVATAPSQPVATPTVTAAPTATPADSFPLAITDDEGTVVKVAAAPQKIVSLTPATTEILFAIGAGDRVAGKVEDIANYPPEAAEVPIVGTFSGVDVEKIVGLGADLVIAGGSGGTPQDAIDKLRSLNIPVVVVYASDIAGALEDVKLTGTATGFADAAADLAASMQARFDQVAAATAGATKPRVFYETGDQPSIYGIADDSVYAQMIEVAGGIPITTGSASNWEMSTEKLISADPELIILGDSAYGVTAEAVAQRAGWSGLTAVKAGAIKPIDDIVVTRPGPRLVDGLLLLASAIHPELTLPSASPVPSGG